MYEQLEKQIKIQKKFEVFQMFLWQSLFSEMKNLSGKLKMNLCKTADIRAKPECSDCLFRSVEQSSPKKIGGI